MGLQKPPLWERHDERGATFTEFGGWEMPVEFDSIRTEHDAVRETAGIFDVSHMGEIRVTGPDATTLMGRLTSNDVGALDVGDSQYATITDESGIVLDDTVVYRLPDDDGPAYLFVPNAGNDEVMADRWLAHRDEWELEATVDDRTDEYAMFAVQGPDARELVTDAVATEAGTAADTVATDAGGTGAADGRARSVADLGRFEATYTTIEGTECWIARTGYTGEDGFELVVPRESAESVWNAFECQPCGLGARDTLRIEAGLLLSGQDFDPETNPRNPYEAGIGFTVTLDTAFVGRDALERVSEEGVEETLIGFRLVDRGVPRHGYDITDADGRAIGTVTSGTMSPTLGIPVGLGYVPVEYADPGTALRVVVRDQPKKARVETTPFIDTVR